MDIENIIARRQFAPLYIWLDTAFLAVLIGLLVWKKKYMTVVVGLIMGVVYMVVDYGIFHLVCHSRSITEGYSLFWVLLWMSMSYGFTNFAWMWLWLSRDEHFREWTLMILLWWLCCPMITNTFAGGAEQIVIERTTGEYHGYMALILIVGYVGAIAYNLAQKNRSQRVNILRLCVIGVSIQAGWEIALLLGGIRSAGFTDVEKIMPLVVNSLLETNLGMPYVYFIFAAVTARFTEQLRRREHPLTTVGRIAEDNMKKETA